MIIKMLEYLKVESNIFYFNLLPELSPRVCQMSLGVSQCSTLGLGYRILPSFNLWLGFVLFRKYERFLLDENYPCYIMILLFNWFH